MTFSWRSSTITAKRLGVAAALAAIPLTIGVAGAVQAAVLPEEAALTVDYAAIGEAPETAAAHDGRELECMAKVVHHEAANQSHDGQLAVAQLLMNRVASGKFADSVCGVAAQAGQFFDVDSYTPQQDGRWATAVAVSMEALNGSEEAVAPGALFFHAAYSKRNAFFRTRTPVATLGSHIFYR
ncbi:MAG: cell wall hydrolase [Sphingomonas fennica]